MSKPSYAQLMAEHDEIDRQCHALIRCVAHDHPDVTELSDRIAHLAHTVSDHIAVEEAVLDPMLADLAKRDDAKAAELLSMNAELDVLKHDWAAFLAAWTPESILSDPTRFCDRFGAMLARMRARVSRESSMLYAALLQSNAITLQRH